jgi:hypothetical protein
LRKGDDKEKKVPKHKLTTEELLKGTEKALRSKKTPPQLRAGIRKWREKLRKRLATETR